jgi:hypothetical protein
MIDKWKRTDSDSPTDLFTAGFVINVHQPSGKINRTASRRQYGRRPDSDDKS